MSPASVSPTSTDPRSYRSIGAWLTLLVVFTIALSADLATKAWSFRHVADTPVHLDRQILLADPLYDPLRWRDASRPALPWGLLDFKLVLNPGAVFGIGAHQRWFFIVFTLAALAIGLIIFGRCTRARARLAHAALALVLAGGLGNLYDRLVYGRVRDLLQVLPGRRLPFQWTWPGTNNPELFPWVFNIADLLLLTGMILLMVHLNRRERRRARRDGDLAPPSQGEMPITTEPPAG